MKDWYASNMSPATASLACSLFRHLGLVKPSPTCAGDFLKVLETHCGDAQAASELLPLPCVASFTACDFSDGMLSLAAERLGDRGKTVLADSTQLPFEGACFDRYMSNLGCCCTSDLGLKLKEACRVLVPGGLAAMSMRIADFEGDTGFHLLSSTLEPFGYPGQPNREGLHIGKDLPALRAKCLEAGFASSKAWRTWVTIPIQSVEDFMQWTTSQPPVQKFLNQLSEEKRLEALRSLEAAAQKPVDDGALQLAVAVVVAQAHA